MFVLPGVLNKSKSEVLAILIRLLWITVLLSGSAMQNPYVLTSTACTVEL